MDPRRQELLHLLKEPASAADLARRMDLPRQKVNYHVRKLASAGYLKKAGRRRKRNLLEQRWQATADAYFLTPSVLSSLAPDPSAIADRGSAEYLLALSSRLQSEVSESMEDAQAQGLRLPTLSISADLGFESPQQRAAFTEALQSAIAAVVAEYAGSPTKTGNRPYRMMVGCHPIPASVSTSDDEQIQ